MLICKIRHSDYSETSKIEQIVGINSTVFLELGEFINRSDFNARRKKRFKEVGLLCLVSIFIIQSFKKF